MKATKTQNYLTVRLKIEDGRTQAQARRDIQRVLQSTPERILREMLRDCPRPAKVLAKNP